MKRAIRAPLARVKRNFTRVMSDVFAITRGKTIWPRSEE